MSEDRLPNQSADVDRFMLALDHPLREDIGAMRLAILASNPGISEQIKWKAPSFCYGDEDRVTFRLPPKGGLQLIFHRGARAKDTTGFAFVDETGLMEWAAADRAIVRLADSNDAQAKQAPIVALVNRWMDATSA